MKKLFHIVVSILIVVIVAVGGSTLIGLIVMGGEDFFAPFSIVTEFIAIFFATFINQGYIVRVLSVCLFCLVISQLMTLVFGLKLEDKYTDEEYEDTDLKDGEIKTSDGYTINDRNKDNYYAVTVRKRVGDKIHVHKELYKDGEFIRDKMTTEKVNKKTRKVKNGYRIVKKSKKSKKR